MTANFSITLGRPLGATLLLGGLLLAASLAVGAAWADLSAVGDERDAKADLLERSVAASRRPGLEPAAAARADPFVAADTATLAAAAVDADLRARTLAAGLALLSSRADARPEDAGGPAGAGLGTRIEVQATVEGQNEALQGLLLALETGTPTVLVDALAVEPAQSDGAGSGDARSPRLRATLTLAAYWRPGRKAAAAP